MDKDMVFNFMVLVEKIDFIELIEKNVFDLLDVLI